MSKQTFDFSEALRRMRQGKKVRIKSWDKDDAIWMNEDLCICNKRWFCAIRIVPKDYLFATDWEEVEV